MRNGSHWRRALRVYARNSSEGKWTMKKLLSLAVLLMFGAVVVGCSQEDQVEQAQEEVIEERQETGEAEQELQQEKQELPEERAEEATETP